MAIPHTLFAVKLQAQLPPSTPRRLTLAEGDHHPASKASAEEAMDYLQESVYVRRALADKEAQEQYGIRFELLMERAKGEEGLVKLETFETANKIAAARKLGADKVLAADAAEAARQVKDMSVDPALAKELQARAAYLKVREAEDGGWAPQGSQAAKLTAFTRQAATAYEGVGKKYEGTVYGTKAAERAVWLGKGVPEKGAPGEKK